MFATQGLSEWNPSLIIIIKIIENLVFCARIVSFISPGPPVRIASMNDPTLTFITRLIFAEFFTENFSSIKFSLKNYIKPVFVDFCSCLMTTSTGSVTSWPLTPISWACSLKILMRTFIIINNNLFKIRWNKRKYNNNY